MSNRLWKRINARPLPVPLYFWNGKVVQQVGVQYRRQGLMFDPIESLELIQIYQC